MIQRVILLFICLVFMPCIHAQSLDSIQSIQGVEITADKISAFAAGLKIRKLDSTTLSILQGANLAVLLSEQSPVYLRSHGPGGLSTLSMRGTNSSQSGIFWNGINLNQPNMGQADLSRISSFDFSDISLQSGSASALLGSGIIGGSLHLSNPMQFSSPVKSAVLLSGASAGKLSGAFKLSAGGRKLAYTGSLSGDWNKNNFWYNSYTGDRERMNHALVKSVSSVHQAEYLINPKQRIDAGFWYQLTDRQVPPTMTMTASDQQQWDQAIRSSLQWSYIGNTHSLCVKTAFIDEKEHYKSQTAAIDAFYHLNTFQTEVEYKQYLGKQLTLGSGASGRIIRADVPYYMKITIQQEGSAWIALAYTDKPTGLKAAINLRQDFTKGYKIPFCPSLSAEIPVSGRITVSFSGSRNFRIPTLNDRYWIPGGNPDLKPENNWNIETGMSYTLKQTELYHSKLLVNLYSIFIVDFIQWVPVTTSIWSPQNVSKVWSRGLEIASSTDFAYAGFKGYFKFGYNYTPSTYKGENEPGDKQLIYTPLHKVSEVFDMSRGKYYALFTYSYTGKRYVKSDNSRSLPSFSILDVFTGYTFDLQRFDVRTQFEVHNLFNTEYQSVLYYPEPGRTYAINLLFSIH